MKWVLVSLLCIGAATTARSSCGAEPTQLETSRLEQDKQRLAPLQSYVGEWRGIGQPKRGSNQGAWSETAQWSWKFADGRAVLVAELRPGKYFSRLEVRPGEGSELVIDAYEKSSSETPAVQFRGQCQEGELIATAADLRAAVTQAALPARITMRLVAGGDRMSVLYERRLGEDAFARLAEVGSTRKGSDFAKRAASGPECVVTGGLGTIEVEYEGKSYFVCCGGCKDLFEEDPAGVLADYRERKAAEKAEPKR